nr:MAG TPA: hypothetical protein [Caudoviricetes sp.]
MSDKFVYEVSPRKKITLPKFGQVPFGVIRKSRKMDPEEQFYFMFEELLDEQGLAVLDSLTADQVADLMDSWQNEAGVGLGESEDSQN